ncbi:MAG: DUF378 domain-containing protein [Methanotrichaceae archaeon]|nr:DUF378 domain-containing protein [Methanotrichaceae archaeon]
MKHCILCLLGATALVLIGGLNWGLVGLLNFNLVEALLGKGKLSRLVYMLVGLASVSIIVFLIVCKHRSHYPLTASRGSQMSEGGRSVKV